MTPILLIVITILGLLGFDSIHPIITLLTGTLVLICLIRGLIHRSKGKIKMLLTRSDSIMFVFMVVYWFFAWQLLLIPIPVFFTLDLAIPIALWFSAGFLLMHTILESLIYRQRKPR